MENRETVNGAVLMVQGTASDVGKSVIVTALCRIFAQDGFRTAPFKSQNMALNSYVTPDGREIGRAQGVQAEACGIAATTDMNPVLIKPTGDMHSQIVVHGQPLKRLSAADYREKFLPEAKPLVMDALNRLRRQYDIVLMEGAGSPAEINLKQRDIVNMNLAGWADAPVILVGDIDRGGVFAFLVGTLELLEPEERARVKGFIINKFRGDLSLLQPGLDWLERRTGIPVLGVLPYLPDLDVEAEDSVVLDTYPSAAESAGEQAAVDIAVIRYPRISNFTDFAPLAAEPDVSLRYVDKPADLGQPDAIILPGTKDTIGDLSFLREQGWDLAIRRHMELREHARAGRHLRRLSDARCAFARPRGGGGGCAAVGGRSGLAAARDDLPRGQKDGSRPRDDGNRASGTAASSRPGRLAYRRLRNPSRGDGSVAGSFRFGIFCFCLRFRRLSYIRYVPDPPRNGRFRRRAAYGRGRSPSRRRRTL